MIPESLRWSVKYDNIDQARSSLRQMREIGQVVEDEVFMIMIREALEFEEKAMSSSHAALWKDRSVRKRLLLALILNAGQHTKITGRGSLHTYSTIAYKKVFKSDSTIALLNALHATCGILFTLNAAWTADWVGRKVRFLPGLPIALLAALQLLFIVGAIGGGICTIVVASVETLTPNLPDSSKSHSSTISLGFLLFLFIFFRKPTRGATVWILDVRGVQYDYSCPKLWACLVEVETLHKPLLDDFFPISLKVSRSDTFHDSVAQILTFVPGLRLLRLLHVRRGEFLACRVRVLLHP